MINKAAAWSLEYVYCSGCSGGMVQFNYGLAEVRRHASLDTDYTHGYLTTTWGWVWPAVLLRSAAVRSFGSRPHSRNQAPDKGVALLHLVLSSPVIDCQPDLITSSVILRSHFARKTALLAPS